MDTTALPVARSWIVRVLAVAAWATWAWAAMSPWYSDTRVDLEPETTSALGIALAALVPFVVATVAAVRRRALPWWSSVAVLALAAPSVAGALGYPGLLEASSTDTELVVERGAAILVAAVLLAVAAVAVASRLRPVRPAGAGWTG